MSNLNGGIGGNQMLDLVKANMLMNSKDNPIYTFFIMTILEFFIKYVTILMNYLKTYGDKWVQDKFKTQLNMLPIHGDEALNEIFFTRKYGKARPEAYLLVDAVLMRILENSDIKKLIYANLTYMVNYKDIIEIDKGISFQLTVCDTDSEGEIETIKFRLFSESNNTGFLKDFIKKCEIDYEIKKKNKLGDNLFFFDHHTKAKDQHGNEYMQDKVFFTRNLFLTNRNLNNIFFEQKAEVKTRLGVFMDNRSWYDFRGVPYTLGFLFHGSVGCGKTSTIKAIASTTQRHIININLGKVKSKTQLKQLFYDEKLWVMEKKDVGENLESYIIPVEKRLYVMEDIDAVKNSFFMRRDLKEKLEREKLEQEQSDSDEDEPDINSYINDINNRSKKENKSISKILKSNNKIDPRPRPKSKPKIDPKIEAQIDYMRTLDENGMVRGKDNSELVDVNDIGNLISPIYKNKDTKTNYNTNDKNNKKTKKDKEEEDDDVLDLSSILNILDGTLETPGRMIIITSNYPEQLDQALIRPGRIDLILEFKKANHTIIGEMFECFFEKTPPMDLIYKIIEYSWSPAEVAQIMFKNFNSPEQALEDLTKFTPKEYFKFSYFNSQEDNESTDNISETESNKSNPLSVDQMISSPIHTPLINIPQKIQNDQITTFDISCLQNSEKAFENDLLHSQFPDSDWYNHRLRQRSNTESMSNIPKKLPYDHFELTDVNSWILDPEKKKNIFFLLKDKNYLPERDVILQTIKENYPSIYHELKIDNSFIYNDGPLENKGADLE